MSTPLDGVPWTSGGVDTMTSDIEARNDAAEDAAESDTELAALEASLPGTYAARVGPGAPKASGGTRYVGVPGVALAAAATRAQTVNQSRYYGFILPTPVSIDQWLFEVTAAPASSANVRVGLTAADVDWQPTGAPIFDVAEAVTSGFTGIKSGAIGPTTLAPGKYLLRTNVDVAMTLRSYVLPLPGSLAPTLGATAHAEFFNLPETFGAMTSPAADWTVNSAGSNGPATPLLLRWVDLI